MESRGNIISFDHVVFWVSNAKTSASYYVTRFGFKPLAVREPSDGDPTLSYAVRLNQITLVFESPTTADCVRSHEIRSHGDFVKDVAVCVDDVELAARAAGDGGAAVLAEVSHVGEDGSFRSVVLKAYGDTTHTLLDRSQYRGVFLPGYTPVEDQVLDAALPETELMYIDHVESNLCDHTLRETIDWYCDHLHLQRFWCVDYELDLTPYSCITSRAVANSDETVRLQLNEGATGLKPQNKASEFVKCHGGPGVEHIALYTHDIVHTMRSLRARGAEIVEWPSTYYEIIREKLEASDVEVEEDLNALQQQHVLIDYDQAGYMLQAFTKHVQPRATVFLEVIQRHNHRGFGAGNYRTVFEALERQDAKNEVQG